jgi:hypothetical protein
MRDWVRMLWVVPLASCAPSLPHPPFSPQATNGLSPIQVAPPPGRVEVIPKEPRGADAWVDGEWILKHGRWYWLVGRWVKVPPKATYSPWVVVRATDGTPFYAPSVWRDATGAAMPPPPPLAVATASGEVVVGGGGDPEETGRTVQDAPRPSDAGAAGDAPAEIDGGPDEDAGADHPPPATSPDAASP